MRRAGTTLKALKYIFWSGMDDIIGQMLLVEEDHIPFVDFINFTLLWVSGSSFTLGVIREGINSDFPEPISLPVLGSIIFPGPSDEA